MEDTVRQSAEKCRAVYDKGFRIWHDLQLCAMREPTLPPTCFQIQDAFLQQPHFQHNMDLKERYNYLCVTGISVWETSQGLCKIPPLEKDLDIPISIDSPTRLTMSSNLDLSYYNSFSTDENHIFVLMLAWSYILSARWSAIMPGCTVLEYTNNQAQYLGDKPGDEDPMMVDIGHVDDDAARWWGAVLAPGEGWHAYISRGQGTFISPWSVIVQSTSAFTLSCNKPSPLSTNRAVSFETAIRFLSDYCVLHGVMDQSHAELSAVLFLPLLHTRGKAVALPRPSFCLEKQRKTAVLTPFVQWHLDKLLTMSCNTKGMRAMLSSVFYEPDIACNAVSPWLQSIFAILDSVKDDCVLAHILMSRAPRLAFLWLGGIIVGIHKEVFRDAWFGLIPIDLHAAMWSGTMQSFIQEPVLHYLTMKGCISCLNEC